jgi:hypothetical protein
MPAGADVEEVYGARGCLVQDVVVEEGHIWHCNCTAARGRARLALRQPPPHHAFNMNAMKQQEAAVNYFFSF